MSVTLSDYRRAVALAAQCRQSPSRRIDTSPDPWALNVPDAIASWEQRLRDRLIQRYMPVIHDVAARMEPFLCDSPMCEKDDLIASGIFAIMEALDDFDENEGEEFEVYLAGRASAVMMEEDCAEWVFGRLVRRDPPPDA